MNTEINKQKLTDAEKRRLLAVVSDDDGLDGGGE
jgi:hypothetical protein